VVNQQQPEDGASQQAPLSPQGVARRRFTKAGAAASGVLLTLHSTSGLATTGQGGGVVCVNSSAGASAGVASTQRVAKTVVTCNGNSPSKWCKPATNWPATCGKQTQFGTVFFCTGTTSSTTFWSYVQGSSSDTTQLCMHLSAVYLNIKANLNNVNTEIELKRMWNDYRSNGFYSPSGGVKWDAAAIVKYLSSTYRNY